ncbi:ribulose-phosphate 3-epimerase, partial [Clavibacter zhangzhiyongii]|nr:ribulose-phosphate 3-epimerase [Clavibacter zhangzhiyongii]
RDIGARAGIALKPGTPVDDYLDLLAEFDQVLVMTVEPGFGGQSFMPETMPKLRALRARLRDTGHDVWLQVDGGIDVETIGRAAEAGADTFVSGSGVFRGGDPESAIAELRRAAEAHTHAH